MNSGLEPTSASCPFPGMDPYLERHWTDFHSRFLVYACDQLNERLPADLQARIADGLEPEAEEYPTAPDDGWHTVYPDESVTEHLTGVSPMHESKPGSVAGPAFVSVLAEVAALKHIAIIQANKPRHVVTVVELLGPAYKSTEAGATAYREKQEEYIESGINLVEIDLLLHGSFVMAVPEDRVPSGYRDPYLVCMRRATGPRGAELFRVRLRKALPDIPIPLRTSDTDLTLQMQSVMDKCYRRGRYASIDYRTAPVPPLHDDDKSWAQGLLKDQGLL